MLGCDADNVPMSVDYIRCRLLILEYFVDLFIFLVGGAVCGLEDRQQLVSVDNRNSPVPVNDMS